MNFRLRIAAWFGVTLIVLVGLLIVTAHHHLDQELREEKWERFPPEFPAWVQYGSSTDAEIQDILGEMMQVWLAVGIPALLVALAVGYWLAERSLRPIRAINRQLSTIKTSTLGSGVTLPEKDPALADLVHHINALLQRIGGDYEQMAGFSSKVAHELRTPLTLVRMKVDQSALLLPPDVAGEMQEELSRLSKFVERSLVAAKAESGHLRQILHNLLGNAVRYGDSRIRVRAASRRDGVMLLIVNDTDPATCATSGIGLGLRLVRALCETTRIRLSVRTRNRSFACHLILPFAPAHS